MNRLDATFAELKRAGRAGLVGYLTAGDPDEATSERLIVETVQAGLDVLELGMPFSDPTADGPEIQAASQRALAAGMTVTRYLALVRRLRAALGATPIVLFGYANPFWRYGFERFCADAAAAGADGLLLVDLPHEESAEARVPATAQGLKLIPLIAPTTPEARARAILRDGGGFVYYIMVKGVTGARAAVADDLAGQLAMLRRCTSLPIAAGFGVSDGAQARAVAACADAVVVGSALVRAAREGRAPALARELRAALERG